MVLWYSLRVADGQIDAAILRYMRFLADFVDAREGGRIAEGDSEADVCLRVFGDEASDTRLDWLFRAFDIWTSADVSCWFATHFRDARVAAIETDPRLPLFDPGRNGANLFLACCKDYSPERHKHDRRWREVLTGTLPRSTNSPVTRALSAVLTCVSETEQAPSDAVGTFKVFDELSRRAEAEGVSVVWQQILQLYERILGWYADRRQYHRIGFLIAQAGVDGRDKMLREIASQAGIRRHSDFGQWLEREVRRRLNVARSDLSSLRYDTDHARIQRLLLLMNVETTAKNKHSEARYPFAAHHADSWELEHIHAQNAPELNTAKQWEAWVNVHEQAVLSLPDDEARDAVLQAIENWRKASETTAAVGDAFRDLAHEILTFLAGDDATRSEDQGHGLGNLALLSKVVNIGLGNSAFEAKRKKIIAYDHEGDFIPASTRHVFLKYYSDADALQPHFWSAKDRAAYLAEIETILSRYLKEETQP